MRSSTGKNRLLATLASPANSAQTYEDFLSQQGNENVSAILLAFEVPARPLDLQE